MSGPTVEQKEQLRDALLEFCGETGANRRTCIIRYLFRESIEKQKHGLPESPIGVAEIEKACPSGSWGGPKTAEHGDNNASSIMNHLYRAFDEFFETERGDRHRYRIMKRGRGNFALQFAPHHPHSRVVQAPDPVAEFWKPYIEGPQPVRIFYPELRFLMDVERQTYFRNPYMDRQTLLASLEIPADRAATSFSFVSSGVTAATTSIMESLYSRGVTVEAHPIRGDGGIPRDTKNFILLGTPTSTQQVASLEESAMHTQTQSVVLWPGTSREKAFEDQTAKEGEVVALRKFGVLTRRRHLQHGDEYVATVLAARHGRAVQGISTFLTEKRQMEALAEDLGGNGFPERFQALFEINLKKAPAGDPEFQEIRLRRTIPTGRKRVADAN